MLLDAFERAAGRGGPGRLPRRASAGIGKSRLLLELRRRVGDARRRGRRAIASPSAARMAFHPLIDLVRRRFGIEEADGEAAIGAKIERGVAAVRSGSRGPSRPISARCCRVDPADSEVRAMSPAQRRGETFEALRRLLVRAAERHPQVLVIEDLHWIDSASEQFLVDAGGQRPRPARAPRLHLPAGLRRIPSASGATSPGWCPPRCRRRTARAWPPPSSTPTTCPTRCDRLDRRQGRGQPVLRRGARQVAGGERGAPPGGRPARADAAPDRARHSRHDPGRDRGPHRPARRGAQAHAPARRR